MSDLSAAGFLELVEARVGHFEMESGLHSPLWLDLDALFASHSRLQPWVTALADLLRPSRAAAVCGPMLGGAFLAQSVAAALDVEFWYTESVAPSEESGLYRARYELPRVLRARLANQRVAIVDDVMSAGSSLRATYAALGSSVKVVAVGSLLQLGDVGAQFFANEGVSVTSVARQPFATWPPAECPLCADHVALERVA